jgi:hypothetical protein
MIIGIKQIILQEGIGGFLDSIKSFIPKKKEFKIESTPADTRRLKAVQNEIQKTKHQLEVVKAHQNIINGKRYNGEPKPEQINPIKADSDSTLFKSSKIHPKSPNPYTKVNIRV